MNECACKCGAGGAMNANAERTMNALATGGHDSYRKAKRAFRWHLLVAARAGGRSLGRCQRIAPPRDFARLQPTPPPQQPVRSQSTYEKKQQQQ